MKGIRVFAAAMCAAMICVAAAAQQPAPTPYFSVSCVKVKPGKSDEIGKVMHDVVHKYAQARVDSGALASFLVLRAVQPSGTTNECDYLVSSMYPGNPPKPLETDDVEALLKKAGVGMSAAEYREKLGVVGELATSGIWQQVAGAGTPAQKGDYMLINYNKSKDEQKWVEMEKKIWMPFAEELSKAGITRSWAVDLRVVPSGPELQYDGVTVDVFPTWDAYFSFTSNRKLGELWNKVHPDLTFEQAFTEYPKVTTQILRQLWVVEDLISASKRISQTGR
jgi:hypothetical protein